MPHGSALCVYSSADICDMSVITCGHGQVEICAVQGPPFSRKHRTCCGGGGGRGAILLGKHSWLHLVTITSLQCSFAFKEMAAGVGT